MKSDGKKEDLDKKIPDTKTKENFWGSSTAVTGVIAVTVFLCFLTVFEIAAIKAETFLGTGDVLQSEIIADTQQSDYESGEAEQITERIEQATGNEPDETESGAEYEPDSVIQDTQQSDYEIEDNTEAEEDPLPYYIKINRKQNVITAYKKDDAGAYTIPVKAMICSTGLHNATPKGIFHLSDKYVWHVLNGGVYGQYACRITRGILFHSVPYSRKNKASLYWEKYNKLGQHASMGCVRLTVEDAKWIYDHCPSGTTVEVYESEDPGPLGKPEAVKLDKDNANKGWDPTDPDENNPWHLWSEDE